MKTPQRIVSLLPASTEILCVLGVRDRLVGVSHECDYPAGIVGLPVLTEPKLDPQAPTPAIDTRMRELVQEGLSIYRIYTDQLQQLQPDLIVTQDQSSRKKLRDAASARSGMPISMLERRCRDVSALLPR